MSVVALTPPFKVGDQVALNSGGAYMTVFEVVREKSAWSIGVKWHDSSDTMQEDHLPATALYIRPDEDEDAV